jgi:hypothetical protein
VRVALGLASQLYSKIQVLGGAPGFCSAFGVKGTTVVTVTLSYCCSKRCRVTAASLVYSCFLRHIFLGLLFDPIRRAVG